MRVFRSEWNESETQPVIFQQTLVDEWSPLEKLFSDRVKPLLKRSNLQLLVHKALKLVPFCGFSLLNWASLRSAQ
jgi:hypothetical protein